MVGIILSLVLPVALKLCIVRGEVFQKELELEAGCDCFNSLGRNSEVQAMSAAGEGVTGQMCLWFLLTIVFLGCPAGPGGGRSP